MRNSDRSTPFYDDPGFEVLIEKAYQCSTSFNNCDSCPVLVNCRRHWDKVCNRYEDKPFTPERVNAALIQLIKAAPVFGNNK